MSATDAFHLAPPTSDDLVAAKEAWEQGLSHYTLRTDDAWWRVVRAPSKSDAQNYAETYYASSALNRFTPIVHAGTIIPAAYAGSTRKVALWEIVCCAMFVTRGFVEFRNEKLGTATWRR